MVTITFDFATLLIGAILGFFVGILISALVSCGIMFDERWSLGFADGWDAKKRYIEKQVGGDGGEKPVCPICGSEKYEEEKNNVN